MDAHKHALLDTLTPSTRSAIWTTAKANGLGVDDVVQALLGRTENGGEGARLLAQKLIGDTDEDVLLDVAKLADTWPMPEPTAAEIARTQEEDAKARAVTRDEKIHQIMKKVTADAVAAAEATYPLDANGVPRLAIIVTGGTLKEGADKVIAEAIKSGDKQRIADAIKDAASPGGRVTIENLITDEPPTS